MTEPPQDPLPAISRKTLRAEELAAQKAAFVGRTIALLLIAPLVSYLTPWPGPLLTLPLLLIFCLLGWGAWRVAQASWGKPWHQYAFVTADFALLTFTLLYPNPFVPIDYPAQFVLRFGTFVYFFVLLAGLTYVYQPRLVLWGGISAALSWSAGILILLNAPNTVTGRGPGPNSLEAELAKHASPYFVDLDVRAQEVAVFLIVAGLLTLAVARARDVALRQARLAQERDNLGRYFPRKTAQMLAERQNPFSEPREHDAAVIFADLVSFTAWAEGRPPRQTIALLQAVHGTLAEVVFRHNGTLDKFIGDGVMATFGTPDPGKDDARNALACLGDMLIECDKIIEKQEISGEKPPRIALGAHFGPVIIGNIGSSTRLEFAVLGDSVNIASRLEAETRVQNVRCLVSKALVDAAGAAGLSHLQDRGKIALRGRAGKLDVYSLDPAGDGASDGQGRVAPLRPGG